MGKKSIRILFFIAVVAFLAGMITSERSWAQGTEESTPAKGEDGWRFLIAPYIWLTAIQGHAEGKRGNKVDINVDLGDAINLIDNIKFIFAGRIEIEKGRWGFIFDGAYLTVRFALAGQHMVHHPDTFGQKWNIQLMVVPVIPKLIKGNLFGE